MTIKEKMQILEAHGWTFTRWSKSKGRWVRCKSMSNRQLVRAIEHAWAEQHNNERMTP